MVQHFVKKEKKGEKGRTKTKKRENMRKRESKKSGTKEKLDKYDKRRIVVCEQKNRKIRNEMEGYKVDQN